MKPGEARTAVHFAELEIREADHDPIRPLPNVKSITCVLESAILTRAKGILSVPAIRRARLWNMACTDPGPHTLDQR